MAGMVCARAHGSKPMRRVLAWAWGAVALVTLSTACSRSLQGAADVVATRPGVVLFEAVTQTAQTVPDTLVTLVTAGAVRVEHGTGAAILDFEAGRIVLLDFASRTFRSEALSRWRARIDAAMQALGDSSSGVAPRFEPAGSTVEIAGYRCERYVLFTTRSLLGSRESVEQQIWVTNELRLPEGAFDAYQATLGTLDSVGLTTRAAYPQGIILKRETRTRPAGTQRRVQAEIESSTVFRVESKPLSRSLFAVPPGYTRAHAASEPQSPQAEP